MGDTYAAAVMLSHLLKLGRKFSNTQAGSTPFVVSKLCFSSSLARLRSLVRTLCFVDLFPFLESGDPAFPFFVTETERSVPWRVPRVACLWLPPVTLLHLLLSLSTPPD